MLIWITCVNKVAEYLAAEVKNMKEWALHYAEMGLAVFPLACRDKVPAVVDGCKAATTERTIQICSICLIICYSFLFRCRNISRTHSCNHHSCHYSLTSRFRISSIDCSILRGDNLISSDSVS